MNINQNYKLKNVLIFLFIYAFIIHSFYSFIYLSYFDFDLYPDYYGVISKNLIAGKGYIISEYENPILWRPPVYIYFLSFIYFVFGYSHVYLTLFQIVLSSFTTLLIFLLMSEVFNKKTGILSALIWPLYPFINYYLIRELPLILFTFFLITMLYFWIIFHTKYNLVNSFFIGILQGILILTKLSFKAFPIFFCLYVVCRGYQLFSIQFQNNTEKYYEKKYKFFHFFNFLSLLKNTNFLKKMISNLSIFIFGLMIVLSPWLIRNYQIVDKFPVTGVGGGFTLWFGNHLKYDGLDYDQLPLEKEKEIKQLASDIIGNGSVVDYENDRKLYLKAIDNFKEHPIKSLGLIIKKSFRLWFSVYTKNMIQFQWVVIIFQLIIILPSIYGIILSFRRHIQILPLVLPVLYFQLVFSLFTATVRYCIPVMPIIIAFSVYGIIEILIKFKQANS